MQKEKKAAVHSILLSQSEFCNCNSKLLNSGYNSKLFISGSRIMLIVTPFSKINYIEFNWIEFLFK